VADTTVRYGSRGADVRRLQELVNKALRPCPHLDVDGHFGPRTESAVRLYQASVGGCIDGVVGTRTWAALKKKLIPRRDNSLAVPNPANFASAPWMAVAMREIGQSEIKGPDHNPAFWSIMQRPPFTQRLMKLRGVPHSSTGVCGRLASLEQIRRQL